MVYVDRNFADSNPDPTIDQLFEPTPSKLTSTSISVRMSTLGMTGKNNITTYRVTFELMTNKTTSGGAPLTVTSSSNPVTISGLAPDSLYKITTQAQSAAGFGNRLSVFYKLSSSTSVPGKGGNTKPVSQKVTAKSFLQISSPKEKDKVSFAYGDFTSIQSALFTSTTVGTGAFEKNVKSYTETYYSFGTSFIFDPALKYTPQSASLGFFLNSSTDSGYFVSFTTSATAASLLTNPIEIFRLEGKQIKKLKDSQKGSRASLDELIAGKTYNVDVKVKISGLTVTIIAYINGFKIEATDTTSGANKNEILDPSQRVALVANRGTIKFDYVYADTITGDLYSRNYQNLNLYYGQFSQDFIDSSYGEFLYNDLNQDLDTSPKPKSFEEFGTVVREIKRRSVRFPSPPSIPIRWTTGLNNLATILSETKDNFKSDVMVLNNSSVTVPLSDRGVNQFSIIGTTIGFSGDIEYQTSPAASYSATEPVIFQTSWLQNQGDVESLANWIKSRIVNKAKIVTIDVFGNPLISVGDIITINYPYQGFTSAQKIIVVRVSQSFGEGLQTQIVGRTL
jgi:hypothetical protein